MGPSQVTTGAGPLGLKILEDLGELDGRLVLLRADLNVPLHYCHDNSGAVEIADDFRIQKALPTIRWLISQGARIRVCTHLGRPKGVIDSKYSITPVKDYLLKIFPEIDVLENLRFDPGEEANDPITVERIVKGCDYFVNDAFGVCHRSHASIVGPPKYLPSAAGRLVIREVEMLSRVVDSPERPFVLVLGGSKVSDKIGLLESLIDRVDTVLVGGGMSFTFLAAMGIEIGDSILDSQHVDFCKKVLNSGKRIIFPCDSRALSPGGELGQEAGGSLPTGSGEVEIFEGSISNGWRGLDIGPQTEELYEGEISDAMTVFWNGPMGVFEDKRFASGTESIARSIAKSKGFTVIGGGDSARAIRALGLDEEIDHLSSGGGASLKFLEDKRLPGLDALLSSGERL